MVHSQSHLWRLTALLALLGCSAPAPKVHRAQQKTFGGDRPVTIDVPAAYDNAKPTPLIVVLHGYSVNGFLQKVYFGFDLLPDEAGVIVAAPDGMITEGERFWNATDACCDFGHTNVDDVGYITGLIRDISEEWNIDPKRVYLAGHSNGAFMGYRLACEHPELIAGMMGLAGDTWLDTSKCHPSEPVSILHIHGDNDGTIQFNGGAINDVPYPSAQQSVTTWAGYDHCTGTFAASGDDIDIEPGLAGAETSRQANTSCPAGIDVSFWTIHGGSHMPTIGDNFRSEVWAWMQAHPKR